MSRADERLAAAQGRVARARSDLLAQVNEVTNRLSPSHLARQVVRQTSDKGWELAALALASPRTRPIVATVTASALGWLLSGRPGLMTVAKLFLRIGATAPRSTHSSTRKSRAGAERAPGRK